MDYAIGRIWVVVLATLAVAAAAPALAHAACPDEDLVPSAGNLPQVAAAVVCLHNEERRAAGVDPVRAQPVLAAAAAAHSADMVARRYFDHVTPDGLDSFERLDEAGYIRRGVVWSAGENIGWGTGSLATPRSMMDAWMRGYGHRLTLLAADFDEIGVGVTLGAPSAEHARRADAVTYAIEFGWREPAQPVARRAGLKKCLERRARARSARTRRAAPARCR